MGFEDDKDLQPSCLLIIDWQKAFREKSYWGERNNLDAEKNVAKLLSHWREKGWPVKHAQHMSTEPQSPLRPNLIGNEFEDCAMPITGEKVYQKTVNSAFIGTTLEQDLRAEKITQLVICGVTTDHCVNTTTRMAGNLGFDVILVADACYTFDRIGINGEKISAQTMHDIHLASINGEFAKVQNVDDLIKD